jgi:hypothetical protein
MTTTSVLMKSPLMHDQAEEMLCGRKLVFLVGSPRSGTSWLQLLLSQPLAVATVPETHLFSEYMRSMIEQWNHDRAITAQMTGLAKLLTEEEFRGLLRNASAFVFAKIAQCKPSATIVLEKTPMHVTYGREILDLWPEAHFIHIIRDPRSVVASVRAASKTWASGWASPSVWTNCERWIVDVSSGRQISSATQNYHEVFYHELISDGPHVLMRIFNILGVAASLEDCQRYIDECNIENLKRLSPPTGFYRLGKTDSWRTELSAWEIALVERLAGPLMSELGFTPVTDNKVMSALVDKACTAREVARAGKRSIRAWRQRMVESHRGGSV